MKRFSLRVSGARVGDAVRPQGQGAPAARLERPRVTKQLGLRVHSSPLAAAAPVAPVGPLAREDYATAEDYE